eukprot:2688103-Ditylum_brightwellii.AAC.1
MKVMTMLVVPDNFPEFIRRRMDVAEWEDGEKLSQSTVDDVEALNHLRKKFEGVANGVIYLLQLAQE